MTIATIATFGLGFVTPNVAQAAVDAGSLVKGPNSDAVYYIGSDMKKYVFPDAKTYFSWYSDFSNVQLLSVAELDTYADGGMVLYRAGTKLVTHPNTAKVYAVEPSGNLRWIPSEEIAAGLYGADWASRVNDINEVFFPQYTVGSDLASGDVPAGSLVKMEGSDTIYLIADGAKRPFASMDALSANGYDANYIITVSDLSAYSDGSAISAADSSLMDVSQGGNAGSGVPVGGTGLTVGLASSSADSSTLIADAVSGDGAQSMAEMMTVNFAASSDGAIQVNTVKFKRQGVPSADSDFSDFYLYDGNELIARYSSISDGVLTFNNSNGLFTVSAGSTKAVTLKVDIANGTSASRNMKFAILSSSDVVTASGATIEGTFPVTGNVMSTAQVSDLGKLTLASSSYSSTVDAGETDYELWRFSLAAADQNVQVKYLKFTNIGTVAADDLQNIKLEKNDGTQYGDTKAQLGSDGTLTFDLSANPISITKGNTEYFSLRGDIVGGTNRNFKFSVQQIYHLVATDVEYGVNIKPNQADSWTVIQAGGSTSISTGSMTVTRATDSPSGNVPIDGTDVTVAKVDFSAVGEDVKISSLPVKMAESTDPGADNAGLYQVSLHVDGSQIGTTTNLVANNTNYTFNFGSNFIVPAGETKTLVVKADIKDGDGDSWDADDAFTVTVVASSGSAQGVTSLATVSMTDQAGYLLTTTANTLSSAKNAAFAAGSSSNPYGVAGSSNVKVGSGVITAGSSEAVDITTITLGDASSAFDELQNVMLKKADGTQIGNTRATVSGGNTYSFNPSSSIRLNASESMVVNVFADVKSGATTGSVVGQLKISQVNGTGVDTNTSANDTSGATLQDVYFSTGGSLSVSLDGNSPDSMQLVTGSTGNHIATFRVEESSGAEDVTVSKIIVKNSTGADDTLINWALYDGDSGEQIGSTVPVTASGVATFNSVSWDLPAGAVKTFKVKADVSAYTAATENTANYAYLATGAGSAFEATGEGSGNISVNLTSAVNANSMKAFRTMLTATTKTPNNSGGSYGASQEVAKIGFTADSNYQAKLRAGTTVDEITDAVSPSGTSLGDGDWTAVDADDDGSTVGVDTTTPIYGTNVIRFTQGATTPVAANILRYTFDSSQDWSSYSKLGFWTRSSQTADNMTFTVTDDGGARASTTVNYANANVWQYVEVTLPTTSAEKDVISLINLTSATALASGDTVDVDNLRLYNDSLNLDISGNLGAVATTDGLAVYFKDSSGTTKMTGYLYPTSTSAATVEFVPTTDLTISSSEQVYTVVTNTNTLMATDDTNDQTLIVSMDLGGVSTAGDVAWYDGAVTATSPITWVSGAEDPITFSFSY
ncbi:MAG: beta strand repeat-containing protein [Candidatus Komeilibacteria bacterium]